MEKTKKLTTIILLACLLFSTLSATIEGVQALQVVDKSTANSQFPLSNVLST